MSRSLRFLSVTTIVALSVALFAVSCGRKKDAIRIGVVVDLTGPAAVYGEWMLNGATIAAEEIAGRGGIDGRPVELIIEDSRSDPKSAVSAMQKMIDIDRLRFVIAGNTSSSTMAMAPIAEQSRSILFATLASSPTIAQAGDYVFRNRLNGLYEASGMAEIAREQGFSRVAVAAINNEAGVPYVDAFDSVFTDLGGTTVARELVMPEETNLRPVVMRLMRAKPEAVFAVCPIEQVTRLIKQSREVGFSPTWLGMSSLRSEKLFELAGDDAEGTIIAAEGFDETAPEYRRFASAYRSKFNDDPTNYVVNGYDAVMLLSGLIGRAGDDPDKVKSALYGLTDYVGAGGELKFDSNGDALRHVQVLVARNGGFSSL